MTINSTTSHLKRLYYLKLLCLVVSLLIISGCSLLKAGKLLVPESFGLKPVAPGLYIETGADEAMRINLHKFMDQAECAIRTAYGEVASHPTINLCITEQCYENFGGGRGSLAQVYGTRILVSPRALNWHFIAHEWSHAEMSTRLNFFAWKRMPQWFDEGVAVAISEAPEHAESQWQFLVAANVPRPSSAELKTFKSLEQWLSAIHQYEEDKNIERKAKGQPRIWPLYSAAGHELRPWLAKSGSTGLLTFIDLMNDGTDFESAYQTASKIETDASQAKLAGCP